MLTVKSIIISIAAFCLAVVSFFLMEALTEENKDANTTKVISAVNNEELKNKEINISEISSVDIPKKREIKPAPLDAIVLVKTYVDKYSYLRSSYDPECIKFGKTDQKNENIEISVYVNSEIHTCGAPHGTAIVISRFLVNTKEKKVFWKNLETGDSFKEIKDGFKSD